MPYAIHPDAMEYLKPRIISLAKRYLAATMPRVSNSEFIQCFVDQRHIRMLADVQREVGQLPVKSSHRCTLTVGNYRPVLAFRARSPFAIPMPEYSENRMADTAPPEIEATVIGMAEHYIAHDLMVDDFLSVLNYLNEHTTDPRVISMFLPAFPLVLGLINRSDREKGVFRNRQVGAAITKAVKAMSRPPGLSQLPYMPRPVIEAAKNASNNFLAAVMAGDSLEDAATLRSDEVALDSIDISYNGANIVTSHMTEEDREKGVYYTFVRPIPRLHRL